MNDVYPPSEDSELLLEVAKKEVKKEDIVLEVGTGSGFVAKNLKRLCRMVVATDISPHAVKAARKEGVEVVRTDLFSGMKKVFTLILFNPPYLELEEREMFKNWMDFALNGGKGGIEVVVRFVDKLYEVMLPEGRAIVILSSQSDLEMFLDFCSSRYNIEVVGKRRMFFEELYALKLTFQRNF